MMTPTLPSAAICGYERQADPCPGQSRGPAWVFVLASVRRHGRRATLVRRARIGAAPARKVSEVVEGRRSAGRQAPPVRDGARGLLVICGTEHGRPDVADQAVELTGHRR
jgi:hypothetical protein